MKWAVIWEECVMTENKIKKGFQFQLPLSLPVQDHVFSGIYHGAYLTKGGELYALGATDPEGILGKKDGMALVARNVVHAAVSVHSMAYVTQDGHLHVHGGVLGRLFAEGPFFTGAKRVFTLNMDAFLALGPNGEKYVFGSNKNNIFGLQDSYRCLLDVRRADDPEILKVMRERKTDFGSVSVKELFADTPSYWKWEKEVRECNDAVLLTKEYQSALRINPTTKYNREDGSPEGIYAFAILPNSYVIRPEAHYMDDIQLAPQNVLDISCPLFEDERAWKQVDPKAHRKAIYIHDEGRWLFLDGTELVVQDRTGKALVSKEIADVDISELRVLLLTTSGRLFQSRWRKRSGANIFGISDGPGAFPIHSFSSYYKGRSLLSKAAGLILGDDWEEIKWKP